MHMFPFRRDRRAASSTLWRLSTAHVASRVSAQLCRGTPFFVSSAPAVRSSSASRHASWCASRTPLAMPWPAKGGNTWAASPMSSVRPWAQRFTTRCVKVKARQRSTSTQSSGNATGRGKRTPRPASAASVTWGVRRSYSRARARSPLAASCPSSRNSCRHSRSPGGPKRPAAVGFPGGAQKCQPAGQKSSYTASGA